jgi:4-hydroxybenzoate polyprenyltransferase/phosphoserine phosphatase
MDGTGDPVRNSMAGPPAVAAAAGDSVPLAVDLDGTLVTTDTLFENAALLLKQKPWLILSMALWLLRGKAALKSEIANRARVNVEHLPFRPELIAWLQSESDGGRQIVLATGAHQVTADAVAAHLGFFHDVLATSDGVNLTGARKRDALVKRFGTSGFDYVGNGRDDVPVWMACRMSHIAGRGHLPSGAAMWGTSFSGSPTKFGSWLRAARPYQWVKNVLVFIPALLNHHVDLRILAHLVITFFAFSFAASGTYIVNDLFDLESDRQHSRKRKRPLASGELTISQGVLTVVLLVAAGFGLSALVDMSLTIALFAYTLISLGYSIFLKNKPILDVVALAFLYTLRVYTGGVVAHAEISPWLFQFSIFLFLSLAFVKRYSELRRLRSLRKRDTPGRGYRLVDLALISQAGVGSGLIAGLVLALYADSREIQLLYPHPQVLWCVCPIFVYWIVRVWIIAHRGNMTDDPILFAFRDRVSYIVGCAIVAAVLLAMMPNAG